MSSIDALLHATKLFLDYLRLMLKRRFFCELLRQVICPMSKKTWQSSGSQPPHKIPSSAFSWSDVHRVEAYRSTLPPLSYGFLEQQTRSDQSRNRELSNFLQWFVEPTCYRPYTFLNVCRTSTLANFQTMGEQDMPALLKNVASLRTLPRNCTLLTCDIWAGTNQANTVQPPTLSLVTRAAISLKINMLVRTTSQLVAMSKNALEICFVCNSTAKDIAIWIYAFWNS